MIDPFSVHPIVLDGPTIRCQLMSEGDIPGLKDAAKEPMIWDHMIFDASDPVEFEKYTDSLFSGYQSKIHVPLSIFHKNTGRIAGATKIMNICIPDSSVTLGGTWLDPLFWGTGVNAEMRQVVFKFCFDVLLANRVEIRIYTVNQRNIRAMSKHGVTYEGTLREARTARNGEKRDVAYFSILAKEWKQKSHEKKLHLIEE